MPCLPLRTINRAASCAPTFYPIGVALRRRLDDEHRLRAQREGGGGAYLARSPDHSERRVRRRYFHLGNAATLPRRHRRPVGERTQARNGNEMPRAGRTS